MIILCTIRAKKTLKIEANFFIFQDNLILSSAFNHKCALDEQYIQFELLK